MRLFFIQKHFGHDLFGCQAATCAKNAVKKGNSRAHGDDDIKFFSESEQPPYLQAGGQLVGGFVVPANAVSGVLPSRVMERHISQDGGLRLHVGQNVANRAFKIKAKRARGLADRFCIWLRVVVVLAGWSPMCDVFAGGGEL